MTLRGTAVLFFTFGITAWLTGCSSGTQSTGTQPAQPISVAFFKTPPASLYLGSATQLSAAVANSPSNLYVTWSVTCGTANACGSFTPTTSSNAAYTTYTAPTAVPAGGSVTVTATSVADPTKSVSAAIAITTTPPPPIVVTFYDPPSASIQPGNTISVSAQVTNDPAATPLVGWTASCSLSQCGTFSLNPSGSKISTFYTAPPSPASSTIVTIKATSVTDPSKFVAAPVSIQLPIAVSINAGVPASRPTGVAMPLSALINNDLSSNPQVTWSVSCSGSTCGSFTPTTTGNNIVTTYTTPSTIPSGGTVTVTATSVTDPTKSASATISIVAATPNPSLPDGSYVYQIYGADGTAVAGVFKAAGGYLIGGEQDYSTSNSTGGYINTLEQITAGSYTTLADGNLQISLQCSDGDSLTFDSSPAPHGRGFITGQFVYGTQFSGTLNLQTSTTPPAAGYAISLQGSDMNDSQVWLGGVLNIDTPVGLYTPGAISGSGSVLDAHYSGSTSDVALYVGSSTVSSPDQYGRVVIQLNASASSASEGLYLAGYPVDATHLALVQVFQGATYQSGPAIIYGVLSGVGIGQGTATGRFTASSLAGSSYVFAASDTPIDFVAGVFTAQTGGSLTGTLNFNNDSRAGIQSPLPFTGTYAVDPTGKVTLSNLTGSGFSYNMYLYLTGNGQALVLSNDSADIFAGKAIQQQAAPFTASSFNGSYELNNSDIPFIAVGAAVIGTVSASTNNGADRLTGVANAGNSATSFDISGNFTPSSNGVFSGTLTGLNPTSSTTQGNFTLYLVDDTQGFAIETDKTTLNLVHLQVP